MTSPNIDYSDVTSQEAAAALVSSGKLVKVLLFPSEFGGQDVRPNVVYIPEEAAAIKEQLTLTLMRFVREGLVNKLEVKPEYKGKSFVPYKISMHAWHSGKEGGFNPTIEVW